MFKKTTAIGIISLLTFFAGTSLAWASPEQNGKTQEGLNKAKISCKHGKQYRNMKNDLAQILGMDASALMTELKSGKTIADVAKAKGIEPSAVVNQLQQKINLRVDEALKEGKISQEKADKIKSHSVKKAEKLVNRDWTKSESKGHKKGVGLFKGVKSEIASVLKMDESTLKTELKAGKSLAQIAQEKGISYAVLTKKIQTVLEANLAQAIKDQKISEEDAAKIKEKIPQKVEKIINFKHDAS